MTPAGEMSCRARMLLHIEKYQHLVDDIYAPKELTQLGMAEEFGKSRAHVAMDMGYMVRHGKLASVHRVIKGSRVKQKAYVIPGHPAIRISERPLTLEELMGEMKRTNERLDKLLALISRCNLKP